MPWFNYPDIYACGRHARPRKVSAYDVIIVSGDAYVDHPAFPTAVIARNLEAMGVKVAVIAQPDWKSVHDFTAFGRPALFFAVTAGAMDSMVANFTSMKMPRGSDRLSPGGEKGFRPKRAVQIYSQRLREAFPESPIVIGGIEASMRRFSHYDFWENSLRESILCDCPADLLVWGMAEAVLVKVIDWFRRFPGRFKLPPAIPQTSVRIPSVLRRELFPDSDVILLPDIDMCRNNPKNFMELSKILDKSVHPSCNILVQPHKKGDVVSFPPLLEDWKSEPDLMKNLHYNRRTHPLYEKPVPALDSVKFSMISHRGCLGQCSFCSLGAHQGRFIRSRTINDILNEIKLLTTHPDFRGTISDIGGPSANMFGWTCKLHGCDKTDCLDGGKCPNLQSGLSKYAELLNRAAGIPKVRHVFIGSGIRYDLLSENDSEAFRTIIERHVSGQLKVAPEHVDRDILRLMRKGENADFHAFIDYFMREAAAAGKDLYIVPYFMLAFPGSKGKDDAIACYVKKHRLAHLQIQEFMPTPGTLASAMYYCEMDLNGNRLTVCKSDSERRRPRELIQDMPKRDHRHVYHR